MSISFDAYIGRDNKRTLTLTQGGSVVPDSTVTRVIFKLGLNCLDTNEVTDPITLVNNSTQIEVQLGLWDQAAAGTVEGHLVVYTATDTNGLAWPENEKISVTFYDWGVCP